MPAAETKPMLDDKIVMLFEGNLKRIFAMKITRSTYRELQNVIFACANQKQEVADFLFETLMTGQVKAGVVNEKQEETLERCIELFTIPARLSQEVFERGEFISIITCYLVTQGEECALLNRIRRIDGEEFTFLSDPLNTINVLQHFAGRLPELAKNEKAKAELEKCKKELRIISERIRQMAL